MNGKKLDCVFVVDSLAERGHQIATVMRSRVSDDVEQIYWEEEKAEDIQADFEKRLVAVLKDGKGVGIVFNCKAGVRGRVIKTYRDAGELTGNRTRNVMVSCIHGAKIRKGMKKRGMSGNDFRHVKYDMDDRTYLDKLVQLFEAGN